MYNTNKNNTFISYWAILISLFILVLVTKTQIYNVQENLDRNETLQENRLEKRTEIQTLNNAKATLEKQWINVDKYLKQVDEAEIIDYLYSFVESVNESWNISAVKSIQFTQWKVNELGFLELNISLSLRLWSTEKLKTILKELTWKEAKYQFYVDNLSFPYGQDEPFTVTIPLKIFYK